MRGTSLNTRCANSQTSAWFRRTANDWPTSARTSSSHAASTWPSLSGLPSSPAGSEGMSTPSNTLRQSRTDVGPVAWPAGSTAVTASACAPS